MSQKKFNQVCVVIFSVVAILYAARVAFGWGFQVADWAVPSGLSVAAVFVAGFLAWSAFRLLKNS